MDLKRFFQDTIELRVLKQKIVQELDKYQLGYGEFEVLYFLSTKKREQPTNIGNSLHSERAGISRLIKLLDQKKLVNYEYDSEDRRRVYVSITSKGSRVVKAIKQAPVFSRSRR